VKTKIVGIVTAAMALILGFARIARADIVELPLAATGIYDHDTPQWTSDFDLGVTLTEISNVYIDWSGEIIAGLAIKYDPQTFEPSEPFPMDVGIYAFLGSNPYPRVTDVWGGPLTYPAPELFDRVSELELLGTTTWSDLLDGKGRIVIGYEEAIMLYGHYIGHGSITLNNATLIVEGVIVPEPASILLLAMCAIWARVNIRRTSRNIIG
jgi:hypothetical protein